jgi:tetratricopeptide (TPR) repeat protein
MSSGGRKKEMVKGSKRKDVERLLDDAERKERRSIHEIIGDAQVGLSKLAAKSGYAEKSMGFVARASDRFEMAAEKDIGGNHRNKRYLAAANNFMKAAEMQRLLDNKKREREFKEKAFVCYREAAMVRVKNREYQVAGRLYEKTLALAKELNSPEVKIIAQRAVGVYEAVGEMMQRDGVSTRAIELYERAYKISAEFEIGNIKWLGKKLSLAHEAEANRLPIELVLVHLIEKPEKILGHYYEAIKYAKECGEENRAKEIAMHAVRRFEHVSEKEDMRVITALHYSGAIIIAATFNEKELAIALMRRIKKKYEYIWKIDVKGYKGPGIEKDFNPMIEVGTRKLVKKLGMDDTHVDGLLQSLEDV